MKEKVIDYGREYNVTVISVSRLLIAVHEKSLNEGFLLTYHGMDVLPKEGDTGKIIFERDSNRGHWQYYPESKSTDK